MGLRTMCCMYAVDTPGARVHCIGLGHVCKHVFAGHGQHGWDCKPLHLYIMCVLDFIQLIFVCPKPCEVAVIDYGDTRVR